MMVIKNILVLPIFYIKTLYEQYLNLDHYQNTCKQIFQIGIKYQTKSHQIQTALYDSTIGPTRYPQLIFRGSYKILPRPYPTFWPNTTGWKYLQLSWFADFITEIEDIVIKYFVYTYPKVKERKVISYIISNAKKVINMNNLNKEGSKHVDKEDYITVLIHLGPTKAEKLIIILV